MNWTAESKEHLLLQTSPLHNEYATYVCLNTHTMNRDTNITQDLKVKNSLETIQKQLQQFLTTIFNNNFNNVKSSTVIDINMAPK